MYVVSVEAGFRAAHGVRYPDGRQEVLHEHDWRVCAYWSRPELDEAGMVIDFEHAQPALARVVGELEGQNLNTSPVLAGANPTAEQVAAHVYHRLVEELGPSVEAVAITEAPGCRAIFIGAGTAMCRSATWFDDNVGEP